jgi:anti-sigma factor ChrR (cupin superfamily)
MNASNRSPLPPWLVERIGHALAPAQVDDAPAQASSAPAQDGEPSVPAEGALASAAKTNPTLARIAQALSQRAAESRAQEQGLVTIRATDTPWTSLADGLHMRELYRSTTPQSLRPGEPLAVELWHVDAGFDVTLPTEDNRSIEWLLVRGDLEFDGRALQAVCSFFESPGARTRRMRSTRGAVLYRRMAGASTPTAGATAADAARATAFTHQLQPTRWEPMMEGVERMMLWNDGQQEAYVIRARAGASAPGHRHAMDEECLVLMGEMYFGDQLMRAGDFQLAAAGRDHATITAHTDALLYQRGEVLGG